VKTNKLVVSIVLSGHGMELSHIAARKRQKFDLWTIGLCTVGQRQTLGTRGPQWTLQPQTYS